ncbi:MAG: hypothetical protein GY810_25965 [Aureispira sp.]|nr:hypothetical protein [Aureispira sp.]
MKAINILSLIGALVLTSFIGCKKPTTCILVPTVLEELIDEYQNCEISEYELEGKTYYKVSYMTTWDDGTPWQEIRAYTLDGEDQGMCGWCGTPPLSLCQRLQDCDVVYRSADFDPENLPAVDVYGVKGPIEECGDKATCGFGEEEKG